MGHLPYSPGVYKIVNKKNGKTYVGASNDVNQRCRKHKSNLVNHKPGQIRRLQKDFDRYGLAAFKFVLLEETTKSNLRKKEAKWIKRFKPEYNVSKNVTSKGIKRNKVQRLRNSIAHKELYKDPEKRLQISMSQGGKPFYILKNKRIVGEFISQAECCREFGLSPGNLSSCLKGRIKSSLGYTFRRKTI